MCVFFDVCTTYVCVYVCVYDRVCVFIIRSVDQAILHEEERVVIIRFGHDWDKTCMSMDEVLYSIASDVKEVAIIYVVS